MNKDFVLILTNEEDLTTDYVVLELKKRNIPYLRLNTERFPSKIRIKSRFNNGMECFFITEKGIFNTSDIISIYYRRPKFIYESEDTHYADFYERELRHFLLGSLLSQNHRWINNPLFNRNAEYKFRQLMRASEIGFNVPDTIVTQSEKDFDEFYRFHKKNIVAKTIKKGFIEGPEGGFIYTTKINDSDLNEKGLLSKFPTLFQQELKKKYDIRVTIIGKKLFATRIESQEISESKTDWRRSQEDIPKHAELELPDEIKEKCFKVMRHFKLVFGAIDMVYTEQGEYYFLEINPNGQWAWIEHQTKVPITKAIVDELVKKTK